MESGIQAQYCLNGNFLTRMHPASIGIDLFFFPRSTPPQLSMAANRHVRKRSRFLLAAAPDSSSALLPMPPQPKQDKPSEGPKLQNLARRFWKVAAPYWSSDDKVQARLQLAAVFALTFGTTGISVGFSFLGRDFFNALASTNFPSYSCYCVSYVFDFLLPYL